jgi:hypothetical protein
MECLAGKIVQDRSPGLEIGATLEVFPGKVGGLWVWHQPGLGQCVPISVFSQFDGFQHVFIGCSSAGTVSLANVLLHAGHPLGLALLGVDVIAPE